MLEMLNNSYFVLLMIGLIISLGYLIWRPESVPAFIFLLLSGLGSFYSATSIQRVTLLKAVLLPVLFAVLLFRKFLRSGRLPLSGFTWVIGYGALVVASCLINGTNINDYRASLGILLIPLVVALCPKNEKTVSYITIAFAFWGLANLMVVVATWAGLGWAKAYSSGNAIYTSHRAQGLMGHSTLMGIYFVISLNAVHILFFQARTRVMRVALFILGAGLAVGLLGTLSRGAFAGWVVSFLFIQYRLQGIKVGSIIGVCVLSGVVLGISSFLNLDDLMLGRFTSMSVDPSAKDRIPLLEMGKRLFYSNPLLGVGLGQGGRAHLEAHNTYMQVLMENGVIGFILFSTVVWKGIRGLRKSAVAGTSAAPNPAAAYYIGLLGSMAAILLDAVTHVFDYLMPLWLILGIGFMV